MKIGDLIVDKEGQLGIILTEPRVARDCEPCGEGCPHEEYYLMDVQFPRYVESLATDEVELISSVRQR